MTIGPLGFPAGFFLRCRETVMFQVYVLQNPAGRFSIGHTTDLERRIGQHNNSDAGLGKFDPIHGPCVLVWSERHLTRADAMTREKQIKSMESARWIRETLLGQPST